MEHRDAKDWPHTTAPDAFGDRDGIDLFDEWEDGERFTAIYVRYKDGTRFPARTVIMGHPAHTRSVLDAWTADARGPVHDYRSPFPEPSR